MHTFVRLLGYGVSIVPFAPYTVRRIGDGLDGSIVIDYAGQRGVFEPGRSEPRALAAVADVESAEVEGDWRLDIRLFTSAWPNHFALESSELSGVPFELCGDEGTNILMQGPLRPTPTDDQLTAPGQVRVDAGRTGAARWLDVSYATDDGALWMQRHHVLPQGFVVTAQARRGSEEAVLTATAELVTSLVPRD